MMNNKNRKMFVWAVIFLVALVAIARVKPKPSGEIIREVKPFIGSIQTFITSTATVQPQNRLEIKPPINGRIENILVKEGDTVKAGETIAWMSSTERAALLDAARARGPEAMKYWQEAFKPTPLIAPIDGQVIVSTDQPGQTVTSSDAVMVLSDKLIVQAQVDETDIGKVALGQDAVIGLDAYPEVRVKGKIDHIYYESKIVNNVTIYQVDIIPETVPPVFRSGMTATVSIIENSKDNALLLPSEALKRGKGGSVVMLKQGFGMKPAERKVETGLSDEKNTEIVSGLSEKDTVIVKTAKFSLPSGPKAGSNPFMPTRARR